MNKNGETMNIDVHSGDNLHAAAMGSGELATASARLAKRAGVISNVASRIAHGTVKYNTFDIIATATLSCTNGTHGGVVDDPAG
jgi:hypothetical protein